ncbi:MAG: hypothetical protein KDC66_22105 [Phaeodactylibacter sp.]|nr:hypothetical protein [Phaeodactylibacter sp.]MCB9273844.1 hypothetical protein [Lewinellaceae bacterium]
MKTFLPILLLAFCSFVFHVSLSAQDGDREYVIVEYMKVKPGMNAKYLECEKAWKLIHQARLKKGLITGWELEEVMVPGGTNAEYGYLTITHLKNWKGIDALNQSWDDATWAALTQGLTDEQKEAANSAGQYRDLIKREIWTGGDMVFAPGTAHPLYRVENFMNIPAGGMEEWVEMETRFVKPVHEKSIAMGNRAGWLMGFMVLPSGSEYPYQASTVDFFNTWEDMQKSNQAAWDAVYPGMSDAYIGNRIESTRTIVRTELRRLVDFVE